MVDKIQEFKKFFIVSKKILKLKNILNKYIFKDYFNREIKILKRNFLLLAIKKKIYCIIIIIILEKFRLGNINYLKLF